MCWPWPGCGAPPVLQRLGHPRRAAMWTPTMKHKKNGGISCKANDFFLPSALCRKRLQNIGAYLYSYDYDYNYEYIFFSCSLHILKYWYILSHVQWTVWMMYTYTIHDPASWPSLRVRLDPHDTHLSLVVSIAVLGEGAHFDLMLHHSNEGCLYHLPPFKAEFSLIGQGHESKISKTSRS